MATTTPNLGLTKPEATDEILATIAALAANMDTLDGIVERGGTDVSFYVRFANGTQICVIRQGAIGEVTNSFGAGYIRSVSAVTWPAAFVAEPRHFAFAYKSSGNAPIWAAGGTGTASTTSAPTVWVNVWIGTADVNNIVERIGIGRWK